MGSGLCRRAWATGRTARERVARGEDGRRGFRPVEQLHDRDRRVLLGAQAGHDEVRVDGPPGGGERTREAGQPRGGGLDARQVAQEGDALVALGDEVLNRQRGAARPVDGDRVDVDAVRAPVDGRLDGLHCFRPQRTAPLDGGLGPRVLHPPPREVDRR